MIMNLKSVKLKFLLVLGLILFAMPLCHGQNSESKNVEGFEFINGDVDELLYAISLYRGVSITADDTVSGRLSFRFVGNDFDRAFEAFLNSKKIFLEKENDVWKLSRVSLRNENGEWKIDASEVNPSKLLEIVSNKTGVEITYQGISENNISVHASGKSAQDICRSICRQFGKNYHVEEKDGAVAFVKVETNYSKSFVESEFKIENDDDGKWHVDLDNCEASKVFEDLFQKAQVKFCLMVSNGQKIQRCSFEGDSLEKTLDFICFQSGLFWNLKDGIYYVYQKMDRDYFETQKAWVEFELSFGTFEKIFPVVEKKFGKIDSIKIDDKKFLIFIDSEISGEIGDFIKKIDVAKVFDSVDLKYISAKSFVEKIPETEFKSKISFGNSENRFFFYGDRQEKEELEKYMEILDVPEKRIRYDLLIIQYQRTEGEVWDPSLSLRFTEGNSSVAGNVVLGSVLNMNVDVQTSFGLNFAASLQAKLNNNEAKVLADTVLFGLNGEKISFKNTNTYRYRDNNLNPETGEPIYSGITREIVSGMTLEITGWVSGDGMITSKIDASLSRQGTDLSSVTGNPPPTSEKELSTQVRGKSGVPIMLTGLLQTEETKAQEKTPWFWKIPLIGRLFRKDIKTVERTEMIIYLVPNFITQEEENEKAELEKMIFDEVVRK